VAVSALKPHEQPVFSTWISANAGSGKTRALVERVVTLLLLGVTPERICCITYTKAAAGEMRERILKALRDLLVMDDAACRARVCELTGGEDIQLARSLFARVLDSPFGGLQLTTIHGFCQQLLKRFPLESGLSPQFTVLEEAESETLQRIARQRVLEKAEGNGELSTALILIAERSGEHGFNELMRTASRQSGWWQEVSEAHSLQLKEAIYQFHGIAPDATNEQLRSDCCQCLIPKEMEAELRAALPHFTSKTDAPFGTIFTRWLQGDEQAPLLDELFPLLFTQAGEPRKKPFGKDVPLSGFMETIATLYLAMVERCRALACAEESYAAALVARDFLEQYCQLKAEYQSLDYDDLIRLTEELLRDYGGWVMTKLDHRIDHLLVDEAQDTSPGQWRIVRTLFEELMVTSGGVGSGNITRSLLVVGDEKQSIFSFQGADPKQFASEARDFSELLDGSGSLLLRQSLENSYRSAQAILTLVDQVATLPPVTRALNAASIPGKHYMKRTDNPVGRVVLHPPIAAQEKTKPEPFVIPQQYEINESTAQQVANRMADEIGNWVAAGRCTPGDILILLWRRQPFADCLIRALETRDIPVAGIDRLMLSEHLAVRDLMALMQWCGYPNDDLALAHVLRSPIIGMDEQLLEDLAFGRTGNLWDRIQNIPSPTGGGLGWGHSETPSCPNASLPTSPRQGEELRRILCNFLSARTQSPYDFLTHVLEAQGTRTRFAARFGEEVHEVLDELKAQAASMPASLAPTIAAFADWVTRSEREVKRQQETHGTSVRIMTVHGSKGLEAPIVLLVNPTKNPDTGRETSLKVLPESLPIIAFSEDGKKAAAYLDAKEALKQNLFDEYYRLLYVALTRARDELHIFGAEPVREGSWYQLVAEAMGQLPTNKEGELLVLQDPGIAKRPSSTNDTATIALPEWARTHPLAPTPKQRILSPSRLMTTDLPVAMGGKAGANIRGVRIHRVLQFLTPTSTAEHIDQLLHLAAPDWDAAERTEAATEISALHASERWLWEYPGHAEVSIGGTVDGQMFSGQIDRLVLTPDAVMVVDYKTGAHVPNVPEATPESYRMQLKIYKALLQPLYPTKEIRCALLWTSTPKLMWMDRVLNATPMPILTKN